MDEDLAMFKRERSISRIQRTSDSGFSLIEVLVAAAVFSIGILGTGVLVLGILNANKVSKDVTIATALAQDKMEAIRNTGYAGLPSVGFTDPEEYDTITTTNGYAADYPDFRRVTQTQCDEPAVGMKTVSVSVYRRTGGSPVVFTTIVSD